MSEKASEMIRPAAYLHEYALTAPARRGAEGGDRRGSE